MSTMDKLKELLHKSLSRKFVVWAISTGLLVCGNIDQTTWLAVSGIYIGILGAADFKRKIVGGTNEDI